jgi:MFS family permease
MASVSSAAKAGPYYGWTIVAACILAQVAGMGLTFNSFTLFLHDWAQDLHVQVSQLQLAMLGETLVGAVVAPVVGALADRLPARPLFVWGLLGVSVLYFGVSAVGTLWQLVALYTVVAPIALCLCTAITANALISRWFVRRRGLALGLSAFGMGVAGVILPPIISHALPEIGWRAIWRIGAVLLALVAAPILAWTIRDRPTDVEGLHYLEGEASGGAAHGHGAGAGGLRWSDVIRRRNFWLLIAVYAPILTLQGAIMLNLGPYAASRGLSAQAGVLLSAFSAAQLAATIGLGLISDRFGNRIPYAILSVVVAAGAALLATGGGFLAVLLGAIVVGVSGGQFTLLTAALAGEFGGGGVGRAYGLCMLFVPVTNLGALGLARAKELTDSYAPALWAMAALAVVGGALALLIREPRRTVELVRSSA